MIHNTPRLASTNPIEAPIPMTPVTVADIMPQSELVDDTQPEAVVPETDKRRKHQVNKLLLKLKLSFLLFGLINNVLYVIILSAALDLVPPATPKGIIAFCNIAPSLVAKIGWPYVLKGRIHYRTRLIGCCILSVAGMLIISTFDALGMRLLGIAFASFSTGLGELTFLQLSTRYHPLSVAGYAVGYFASGTGAAGLVGAALWWFVRSLGVRLGISLSAILPFVIPFSYIFLLPRPLEFTSSGVIFEDPNHASGGSGGGYAPIPTNDVEEDDSRESLLPYVGAEAKVALSLQEKWTLLKPLILKYTLPLTSVYLFEYTINQGISPTLIYPVPSPEEHPFLSHLIQSLRDYYPLWQLVYQTTVCISRSSISVGLPPLPSRLLPFPAVIQAVILLILTTESAIGIFDFGSLELTFFIIFALISLEGICGGLAYVNTYFHIGQEDDFESLDTERARQEREFRIGSIGFSDSVGILCASLLAVPTELELCKAQVRRGKLFCKEL